MRLIVTMKKSSKVDPLFHPGFDKDGNDFINFYRTRIGQFKTLTGAIEDHQSLCAARQREMREIVMEGKCQIPWWKALWAVAGSVLGCISTLAGFVLWPTDNVFIFPEKWWQCMIQCAFIWNGEPLCLQ